MAEQLLGETIHHACGISRFDKGAAANDMGKQSMKQGDVAKRVLQWRWLIIDEISMVSAALLAQMDVKLRDVVRRVGSHKVGADGADRPFSGLNVLCVGDFWQLSPPDGGFLGAIPTEFIQRARRHNPAPDVAHGHALFWGGPEIGIQGVTELVENERCQDPWWREVQSEVREGRLSKNNFNFLHGHATT
eukprot:2718998-Heterocapsa_arctica.AAC.1